MPTFWGRHSWFDGDAPEDQRKKAYCRQIEKSATSIGANVAEAKSAQSRADFISKFEIALKEARETDYWLKVLAESRIVSRELIAPLVNECWEITAILVASVKTAKKNAERGMQKAKAESRDQN